MPLRVVLATNMIAPYRLSLFSALARIPDWDFKVFSCCKMEFDRQWNAVNNAVFAHKRTFSFSYFRRANHVTTVRFTSRNQVHIPVGLWWDLLRSRPDVVISGEMGVRSLISGLYAMFARKPFVVWTYGTPHSERDISWKQKRLRRLILSMADAVVGMGGQARDYLQSLGVPSSLIFDSPNAIDGSFRPVHLSEETRKTSRERLGISGLCYLYVGKIIEAKGMNQLLEAWQKFSGSSEVRVTLVLVGDGDQKEAFARKAAERALNNIRFVPFTPPEQLPEIYHAADVFVFPTLQDVWGLVVNEALMFGLPVVCSKYAGCATDLIAEGRNGWIVDPEMPDDLLRGLHQAWRERWRKEHGSGAARRSVAGLTIERMADGFFQAVEFARSGRNGLKASESIPQMEA